MVEKPESEELRSLVHWPEGWCEGFAEGQGRRVVAMW